MSFLREHAWSLVIGGLLIAWGIFVYVSPATKDHDPDWDEHWDDEDDLEGAR